MRASSVDSRAQAEFTPFIYRD